MSEETTLKIRALNLTDILMRAEYLMRADFYNRAEI